MSKNWTFQKLIGLGLNFTFECEVCYKEVYKKLIVIAMIF